jgi:hypothetical protein
MVYSQFLFNILRSFVKILHFFIEGVVDIVLFLYVYYM